MMKKIIYFILLLSLVSCGYYRFNYIQPSGQKELTGYSSDKDSKTIYLKDVDEVYYRDNDSTKGSFSNQEHSAEETSYQKKLKNNLKGFDDFQYIIIKGDMVIYISTTPSTRSIKHRNYFFSFPCDTLNRSALNSYYFNTFLIGKIDKKKENIVFKNEKTKIQWNISNKNKRLEIDNIDVFKKKYKGSSFIYEKTILPEKSIDIGFAFKKIDNFEKFYYSNDYSENIYDPKRPSVEKFIFKYDHKKNISSIMVIYNKEINDEKNAEEYRERRIKYSDLME